MKLINLTPHEINIIGEKSTIIIKPSGKVARCETCVQKKQSLKYKEEIVQISKMTYKGTANLPEEQNGIYYIVSYIVASSCSGRQDLLIPTDFARNGNGQIIGCYSLAKVS